MGELQNMEEPELIYCRTVNHSSNNTTSASSNLDNRQEDPLGEPEVSVNLNETSLLLPPRPTEELAEVFLVYEGNNMAQEGNTDSEEQVVPSSQLSNSHKYPDDLTISDDEIDEGIFEDEMDSIDITETAVIGNDHTHNVQPP